MLKDAPSLSLLAKALRHFSVKPTLTNLALDWDGLHCRHTSHPASWNSSDLARWGWHSEHALSDTDQIEPGTMGSIFRKRATRPLDRNPG